MKDTAIHSESSSKPTGTGNKMALNLSSFGVLPQGFLTQPAPFTLNVPMRDVHRLSAQVDQANIGIPQYYNTHADPTNGTYGVSRSWLIDAQETWLSDFDWRAHEQEQNKFPNFRINVTIPSDGQVFDLHFAALFSKREDAVPITFLHGWPGSWMEFIPVMELLAEKYTADTLPYHVVVPSIPDYGLSFRHEETKMLTMAAAGEAINTLMIQLGFGSGYVAQGGDVGSFMSQVLSHHDECKAYHLNMFFMTSQQQAIVANLNITAKEQEKVDYAAQWATTGNAYAVEHGTRPSTLSLVLQSSPVAMLAWMGEKLIEWSDNRHSPFPSIDTILSFVSYYWLTNSYARSMWAYTELTSVVGGELPAYNPSLTKPMGYSCFPVEIATLPESWARALFPNMVFYGVHEKGGHFAALQAPEEFLSDMEEFLRLVKNDVIGQS
ncbi:putative epoxide hydrolase [Triangularia verruculosa]|uniref:Epoxide hydrolase n=1 Tax=Triangularia verruculosa TaxID=2587418 RepID=A0AAN7AX19_9PEZI|nr:putative epoxide hydrolase [Triangularia verruculosa]